MSKLNPLVASIRLVAEEAKKNGGTVLAGGFYGDDAIVIVGSNDDVYIISIEETAAAKVVSGGRETFLLVGREGVAVTYEYRVAANRANELGLFKPTAAEEPVVVLSGEVVEHFKEASRRAMLLRSEALAKATQPS